MDRPRRYPKALAGSKLDKSPSSAILQVMCKSHYITSLLLAAVCLTSLIILYTHELPSLEFLRASGMRLPAGAEILASGDTRGGLHGDGDYFIMFMTESATIHRYLASF